MTGATAILVAGMHRSGTSALAGALSLLGVPLGQRLLEPGPDNPKGYWEHRDIVAVHERLLAALGSRWDDVRALPAGWLASDAAVHAAAAIGELVARDFAGKPLWAVKDPRLCRFLPLWFQVLGRQGVRPVVLFMVRDPSEVAESIEARNHWHAPIGEMLWLRYVTEAAGASRDATRAVVVYDDLLNAPLPAVSRALAELDLDFDPATATGRNDLAGFIDKADCHHVRCRVKTLVGRFAEISQIAYGALLSIARGKDAWAQLDMAATEFSEYWRCHGVAIDALADMSAKLAAGAELEWVENRRLSSKLDAQIRWSDEAQASRETLQAENAGLRSKVTAQIQWSEQAVQKLEALQAENAALRSKLTAQIQWSEQAVQKQEALHAELAIASARLAESLANSSALKAQLDASETTRHSLIAKQQRIVDDAEREHARLTAELSSSQLGGKRLYNEVAALLQRQSELEGELRSVYTSRSWRVTKPFRRMAGMLGASVRTDGNDKRDAE